MIKKDNYINFLLAFVFSFSAAAILANGVLLYNDYFSIFLLTGIFTFLFSLIKIKLRYIIYIYTFVCLSAILTALISFIKGENFFYAIFESIGIEKYVNYAMFSPLPFENYTGAFNAIFCIFSVIIGVFSIRKRKRPLLLFITAIFVVSYIYLMNLPQNLFLSFLLLAAVGTVYLIKISEKAQQKCEIKQKNGFSTKILVLPVCLLVIAFSSLLPQITYDLYAQRLFFEYKAYYNSSFLDFLSELNVSPFDFASTGFTKRSGKLGGNIYPDKTPVMTVKTSDPSVPVYLCGSYKNNYTGESWTGTDNEKDYMPDLSRDISVIEYENNLISDHATGSFLFPDDSVTYNIKPVKRQKTIFTPMYTTSVSAPFFKYSSGDFENLDSKNFKNYTVTGLLREYLFDKDAGKGYYEKRRYEYSEIDTDKVNEYVNHVRYNYTAVPDSVSDRVKKLAKTLSSKVPQGAGSFEYRTAFEILKYLEENYTYTMTPGSVPSNTDFVDYFLFENNKGYCVYFASAMAVLARCAGIPARYCEGFASKGSEEEIILKNENAHAWTELYFEGFGWVRFDPSASTVLNTPRSTNPPENNPKNPPPTNNTNPTNPPAQTTIVPNQTNTRVIKTASEPKSDDFNILLIITPIITLILLFLTVILFFIKKKKPTIRDLYLNILKLLELDGYIRNPGETPKKFAKKLKGKYVFDTKTFADITKIYCDFEYNKTPPTEADRCAVADYRRSLYKSVVKNSSLMKKLRCYFVYKKL